MCTDPSSGNNLTSPPNTPGAPPDYSGDLNVIVPFRFTDERNSGPTGTCSGVNPSGCTLDATLQDMNMALAFDCAVTPNPGIGAFCTSRWASMGALCGCVPTGKRWSGEIGATPSGGGPLTGGIYVMDGGTDGVIADLVPDTDGPALFARQGIFVP